MIPKSIKKSNNPEMMIRKNPLINLKMKLKIYQLFLRKKQVRDERLKSKKTGANQEKRFMLKCIAVPNTKMKVKMKIKHMTKNSNNLKRDLQILKSGLTLMVFRVRNSLLFTKIKIKPKKATRKMKMTKIRPKILS